MIENTTQEQSHYSNQPQIALPNATAVLILGIISIVSCCCYGGGLIFAIITLVLASKDQKRYLANPQMYTPGSYSNLKAGKICAYIALAICIAYIVFIIVMVGTIGWETLRDPEALKAYFESMQ